MSETQNENKKGELLRLTAEVVAAYLSKNTLTVAQVPELIRTVYTSLGGPNGSTASANMPAVKQESGKPAVSVRRSITPEYLVCLEDGKKLKMLKRHLRTVYNMTPEQYRTKWNLPADYPMVAPKYAEQRSVFAKKIGLGKDATGRKGRTPKRTAEKA